MQKGLEHTREAYHVLILFDFTSLSLYAKDKCRELLIKGIEHSLIIQYSNGHFGL